MQRRLLVSLQNQMIKSKLLYIRMLAMFILLHLTVFLFINKEKLESQSTSNLAILQRKSRIQRSIKKIKPLKIKPQFLRITNLNKEFENLDDTFNIQTQTYFKSNQNGTNLNALSTDRRINGQFMSVKKANVTTFLYLKSFSRL